MWLLIKKELRENFMKFVVMFAVIFGTALSLIPYSYNMSLHFPKELLNNPAIPKSIMNQLGAMLPKLKDINFFIYSQWFGKNLWELALFFAIIVSIGAIAGETERKSSIYLFSRPVTRKSILLSKLIVIFTFLIITVTFNTYLLPILANKIHLRVNMHLLNIELLYAIIGTLATAAISILFSTLIDERVRAGLAAFAVVIGTIPISHIKGMSWISITNLYISWKAFKLNRVYSPPIIWGIVIIIACITFSYYILREKEF